MKKDKYHLIGIGGIGMSALARVLLDRKVHVSGSDLKMTATVEALTKAGAQISIGHNGDHVNSESTVIYSSDVKKENLEYERAFALGCPILHRSDLLCELMRGYNSLAVAGTHGKTTTSSLLAWVLMEAKLDPAFAIGGIPISLQKNGKHGQGEYFVAEADESDGSFLKYDPFGAIVTNVEPEHLNHYGSEEAMYKAFDRFMAKVSSADHLFWCGDDQYLCSKRRPGTSYGFESFNQLKGSEYRQEGFYSVFSVTFLEKSYSDIRIPLTGHHNALNALAVFGLALKLGIPETTIREAFLSFKGVARRCERKGESRGVTIYDDYGHHPTEVRATLEGLRAAIGARRLIVVFQPHRYTRTRDCLTLFGKAFEAADELILTDLYSAGESVIEGIHSQAVLEQVQQQSFMPAQVVPMNILVDHLAAHVRPLDVVVTMGAGDVTYVGGKLLTVLHKKPPKKLVVGVVGGGRSIEHDVSLWSAKFVHQSLRRDYYTAKTFAIDKKGHWIVDAQALEKVEEGNIASTGAPISAAVWKALQECDVVVPVFHGHLGEDGLFSALLEVMGKAYVGCDHRAAAVCMDKAWTKRIVMSEGIRSAPFVEVTDYAWKNCSDDIFSTIVQTLPFPVFVKPVHLGSTYGVRKVEIPSVLRSTIGECLNYDKKLIVEKGMNVREIEFAVLGNDVVHVTPPGEVLTAGKIYDFEGKYSATGGCPVMPVAELSEALVKEGRALAEKVYRLLGCAGLARVDFFLDEQNVYWLNEVNPMPGLRSTSIYTQMWQANGLDFTEVLDQMIALALERKRAQY